LNISEHAQITVLLITLKHCKLMTRLLSVDTMTEYAKFCFQAVAEKITKKSQGATFWYI